MSSDVQQRLVAVEQRLQQLERAVHEAAEADARRRRRAGVVRLVVVLVLVVAYALSLKRALSLLG